MLKNSTFWIRFLIAGAVFLAVANRLHLSAP